MEKLNSFLDAHFSKIALVFLVLIFFNTCGDGGISKTNKRIETLSTKIDSLSSTAVTKKDLQIEGLKSEKRMIQSTDRKILDVNRQSEIDKELETLQK
jgi:membrane protein required for beta-lactamase induction